MAARRDRHGEEPALYRFPDDRTLLALTFARGGGTRVIWTAHNLGGHDRAHPRLLRLYELAFTALVTDVISLSDAAVPLIRARYPSLRNAPVHVIPHGDFRSSYSPAIPPELARGSLALLLNEPTVLQFGLRRYNGLESMIEAFRPLEVEGARLVVAGQSKDDRYTARLRELDELVPPSRRVRLATRPCWPCPSTGPSWSVGLRLGRHR